MYTMLSTKLTGTGASLFVQGNMTLRDYDKKLCNAHF